MRYCLMVAAPGVGLNWLRLPDSNRRPSAYEAAELPLLQGASDLLYCRWPGATPTIGRTIVRCP